MARRGSLIKFLAECGHWMDCYSLEPTPDACPDCAQTPRTITEIGLPLRNRVI